MARIVVSYVHGRDIEEACEWIRELMQQFGVRGLAETVDDDPETDLWVRVTHAHEPEQVYVGVFAQVRFDGLYGETEVSACVHRLRPRPHEDAPEQGMLGRVRGWLRREPVLDSDALWAMTDDSAEVILIRFGLMGPSLKAIQEMQEIIENHGLMRSDYRVQ